MKNYANRHSAPRPTIWCAICLRDYYKTDWGFLAHMKRHDAAAPLTQYALTNRTLTR